MHSLSADSRTVGTSELVFGDDKGIVSPVSLSLSLFLSLSLSLVFVFVFCWFSIRLDAWRRFLSGAEHVGSDVLWSRVRQHCAARKPERGAGGVKGERAWGR